MLNPDDISDDEDDWVTGITCPVCGFPDLREPPRHWGGGASLEFCQSCGFQFGFYDNARGISYDEWRTKWIRDGMKWSSPGMKVPKWWNPVQHLRDEGLPGI